MASRFNAQFNDATSHYVLRGKAFRHRRPVLRQMPHFARVSHAVAVVCHSSLVTQRFLFRAQEKNMTNGDYVFFTFSSLYSATPIERPWEAFNMQNENVEERLKVFHSVKQVRAICRQSDGMTATALRN